MALRRRSPFGALRELEERLNNLFPATRGEGEGSEPERVTSWRPRVDIYESDDSLVIELEAAGVTKDDIDVSLDDNRLTISGERLTESTEEERDYVRSERLYGSFQRSFQLPKQVDAESIHAEFRDGVLTVTLPTAEQARKKQIEIQ